MIMSVQFSSEHCSHVCHDHVSQNEGTSLVTDQLDTHTTAPASLLTPQNSHLLT